MQRAFNSFGSYAKLAEDGEFGPGTETVVKNYQANQKLVADGVAGPATQAKMVKSCLRRIGYDDLPEGLVEGIVEAESGGYIAAVNWSSPGGVDCGFTQRRVYDNPYSSGDIEKAFDSLAQIKLLVTELRTRYGRFRNFSYVQGRQDDVEYGWRLAALAHNWPYGADRLAAGNPLSDRAATWVPQGTKFPNGNVVNTYAEWAKFYAMGSKANQWPGAVTKLAYGVPRDG